MVRRDGLLSEWTRVNLRAPSRGPCVFQDIHSGICRASTEIQIVRLWSGSVRTYRRSGSIGLLVGWGNKLAVSSYCAVLGTMGRHGERAYDVASLFMLGI